MTKNRETHGKTVRVGRSETTRISLKSYNGHKHGTFPWGELSVFFKHSFLEDPSEGIHLFSPRRNTSGHALGQK